MSPREPDPVHILAGAHRAWHTRRSTFDPPAFTGPFSTTLAKHKLEPAPDPEVQLIGISSHVNDYRLCWALNRRLGIALARRTRDIEEQGPEGVAHFSAFDHLDEAAQPAYTLVNNHSGDGVLLREQRQADYFLVVDANAHITDADLLEQVRDTEFVLTAFTLDMRRLRDAHKLLQ